MARRERRILTAIVALAVVLRVAAAVYLGNTVVALPGTADQVSYQALAIRVAGGHGFSFDRPWWPATGAGEPTAHWSYLYTLYLAGIYAVVGAHAIVPRLLQAIVVGTAQPVLTFVLGRRLFGSPAGLLAALAAAVYAYFVYYAAALMTESFFIVGVLVSLLAAMRLRDGVGDGDGRFRWAVVLGGAMGATALLRQEFLLLAPFLVGWILVTTPGPRRREAVGRLVAAGVVTAGLILPWTVYNYARFDRFVLLNTNAGFAFFWANHPIYGSRFQSILPPEAGTYGALIPEEFEGIGEAAMDRALLRRGIGFVAQDPARYVLLSASRLIPYFKFWPDPASATVSNVARVVSFGLLMPFMVLGVALAAQARPTAEVVLLLLVAGVVTAIHLLSWALIRYRLPVDAVLLPFAGHALAATAGRLGWRFVPNASAAGLGVA